MLASFLKVPKTQRSSSGRCRRTSNRKEQLRHRAVSLRQHGFLVRCMPHSHCACVHVHKKVKSFPSHKGPQGGADLRFLSPQPDTSLHCETTDTGLVYRAVCLFTPQLSLVLITLHYITLQYHYDTLMRIVRRVIDHCQPVYNSLSASFIVKLSFLLLVHIGARAYITAVCRLLGLKLIRTPHSSPITHCRTRQHQFFSLT